MRQVVSGYRLRTSALGSPVPVAGDALASSSVLRPRLQTLGRTRLEARPGQPTHVRRLAPRHSTQPDSSEQRDSGGPRTSACRTTSVQPVAGETAEAGGQRMADMVRHRPSDWSRQVPACVPSVGGVRR